VYHKSLSFGNGRRYRRAECIASVYSRGKNAGVIQGLEVVAVAKDLREERESNEERMQRMYVA